MGRFDRRSTPTERRSTLSQRDHMKDRAKLWLMSKREHHEELTHSIVALKTPQDTKKTASCTHSNLVQNHVNHSKNMMKNRESQYYMLKTWNRAQTTADQDYPRYIFPRNTKP